MTGKVRLINKSPTKDDGALGGQAGVPSLYTQSSRE